MGTPTTGRSFGKSRKQSELQAKWVEQAIQAVRSKARRKLVMLAAHPEGIVAIEVRLFKPRKKRV